MLGEEYKVRVVWYHPGGARGGVVPMSSFGGTWPTGDIPMLRGSLSLLDYDELPEIVELAYEWYNADTDVWVEPRDSRFLLNTDDDDDVDRTKSHAINAAELVRWKLTKAIVEAPPSMADLVDGHRMFNSATPGAIIKTIIDEEKALGWSPEISYDFTATHDSAGVPWASVYSIGYQPGTQAWVVLSNLIAQEAVDVFTEGRLLRVFNFGGATADHTVDGAATLLATNIARNPQMRTPSAGVVVVRTNLCKDPNTTNATNYAGGLGTRSIVGGWLRMTAAGSASTYSFAQPVTGARHAASTGDAFAFRVRVKAHPTVALRAQLQVASYDAANAGVSPVQQGPVVNIPAASGEHVLEFFGTVPVPGAGGPITGVLPLLYFFNSAGSAPASGDYLDSTDWDFELGPTAPLSGPMIPVFPGQSFGPNYATKATPTTGAGNFWLSNNGTLYPITFDATVGREGRGSSKSTRAAGTPGTTVGSWYGVGATAFTPAGRAKVVPGLPVTLSVYWRTDGAGAWGQIGYQWFNKDGTAIGGYINGPVVPGTPGVFNRAVIANLTPPQGAHTVGLALNVGQTATTVGGEVAWATDAQVEYSPTVSAFNTLPPCLVAAHIGTVNASVIELRGTGVEDATSAASSLLWRESENNEFFTRNRRLNTGSGTYRFLMPGMLANQAYTAIVRVRASATSSTITLRARPNVTTGTGEVTVATLPVVAGQLHELTYTFQTSATAPTGNVGLAFVDSFAGGVGRTFDVFSITLVPVPSVGEPYTGAAFDGSSTDYPPIDFTWAGTPDLSRSNMTDLTPIDDPVRVGRAASTRPNKRSLDDLLTDVVLYGEGGYMLAVNNPAATTALGKLRAAIRQGGVSDPGTATLLAQARLAQGESIRQQLTVTEPAAAASHLPFADYNLNDWVEGWHRGAWHRVRVAELVVRKDLDGTVHVSPILNDRFLDLLTRVAKRTAGIVGGALAGGNGGSPAGDDRRAPKAPVGLAVVSSGYWTETGTALSAIALSCTAVTQGTNNVAIDVGGYEWWGRPDDGATEPVVVASSAGPSATDSPYNPGDVWRFKVRAISRNGIPGAFSAESSPITMNAPAVALSKPSPPDLINTGQGLVVVVWDGTYDTDPVTYPGPDFLSMLIEQSAADVTDFDTVGELRVGAQQQPFPLAKGSEWFFRFVPLDRNGNRGTPSDVRSVIVAGIDGANVQVDTLDGNVLKAGTIYTRVLAAEVGQELDLFGNDAINFLITRDDTISGAVTDVDGRLAALGLRFRFGVDGLGISEPGDPRAIRIANGLIQMKDGASTQAEWEGGEMRVPRIVTTTISIGGRHKIEAGDGNGSVWRDVV